MKDLYHMSCGARVPYQGKQQQLQQQQQQKQVQHALLAQSVTSPSKKGRMCNRIDAGPARGCVVNLGMIV